MHYTKTSGDINNGCEKKCLKKEKGMGNLEHSHRTQPLDLKGSAQSRNPFYVNTVRILRAPKSLSAHLIVE